MKSIQQNGRPFNAPTVSRISDASCLENSDISFSVDSHTTLMGDRTHTVTTPQREFALAIYEQVLDIDVEPEFATRRGSYVVEFIATDADAQTAILVARGGQA